MADTSNLSNYLKDVADAIRTKKETTEQIPAEQFDQEILSIETGVDTSDADATSADLVWGKTAYVNGEKVTGNISESRGGTVLGGVPNEFTISDNPGVQNAGMVIKGVSMGSTGSAGAVADDTTTFHINPFKRDVAQGLNLTPDKLVKGNTILGVEGTAESGIDTSDADATAHDIIESKTAYVNGEKITGTFPLYGNIGSATNMDPDSSVIDNPEAQMVRTITHKEHSAGYTDNAMVETDTFYDKLVPAIGLTADKIVKGNTILGVEGTAEGGSGTGEIKLFETEEQMQADENAQVDDKAVIYRKQMQGVTQDTEFQICEFPNTVILDTAFTDNTYGMFRSVDNSKWFDANAELSQTQFRFNWYGEGSNGEVTYTSEDGITYTRTDTLGDPIDFGTTIKSEYEWNDLFGKFIFASSYYFGGLFKYEEDFTETSIYKNANYLADTAKFYKIPKVVSDLFKTGRSLVIPTVVNPNRDYFDVVSGTLYTSTMAEYRLVEQPSRTLLVFGDFGVNNDESVAFEKIDFDLSLDNPIVAKTNITLADMKTYPYQFKLTGLNGNWYSNIILTDQILVNINLNIGTSILTTDDPKPSGTVGTMGIYYNVANLVHNVYVYADTQLTLKNPNELLPGKVAYGKNGIIEGDGSIWLDNIDLALLQNNFGFPIPKKESTKYYSYKVNAPYTKCLNAAHAQPFKTTIVNNEDNILTKVDITEFSCDYNYSWDSISIYNNKIYGGIQSYTTEVDYYVYDIITKTCNFNKYTFPVKLNSLKTKIKNNKLYIFGYITTNIYTLKLYIVDLDTGVLIHQEDITQSSSITSSNNLYISIPNIEGRADAYLFTCGKSSSSKYYFYGYSVNGNTIANKYTLTATTTYNGTMAFREGVAVLYGSGLTVTAIDLEDTGNKKSYTNTGSINSVDIKNNESLNGYIPVNKISDGNDSVLFYNVNTKTFTEKSNIPSTTLNILDDGIYVLGYNNNLFIMDKDFNITTIDMGYYSLNGVKSNGDVYTFQVNTSSLYDVDISEMESGKIKFKSISNMGAYDSSKQLDIVELEAQSVKQYKYNEYDFTNNPNSIVYAGINEEYPYTSIPFVIYDNMFINNDSPMTQEEYDQALETANEIKGVTPLIDGLYKKPSQVTMEDHIFGFKSIGGVSGELVYNVPRIPNYIIGNYPGNTEIDDVLVAAGSKGSTNGIFTIHGGVSTTQLANATSSTGWASVDAEDNWVTSDWYNNGEGTTLKYEIEPEVAEMLDKFLLVKVKKGGTE